MIKVGDRGHPLNVTWLLLYECESCKSAGEIRLQGSGINLNDDGNPEEPLDDYECPRCGREL